MHPLFFHDRHGFYWGTTQGSPSLGHPRQGGGELSLTSDRGIKDTGSTSGVTLGFEEQGCLLFAVSLQQILADDPEHWMSSSSCPREFAASRTVLG